MSWPVDPQLYVAFCGVMAVLAVTPGPANLFSIATGMERGRRAVLLAVAGMNLATLVWFGAAALGLGALVTAFPQAFRWIAIAGAIYVGWLGVSSIRAALTPVAGSDGAVRAVQTRRPAFVDGFLVQLANPKAVLFFTAVLPPFLDVDRPAAPQLALFAAAVILMDVITMTTYGFGGAALARRMDEPRFRRWFGVIVGLLLLTAAVLIVSRL
ncbi:LysE family translocator [Brevundimonas bacteroides]|uniref:LysE family translocator n=1 Tax=Brevundimonas bacteroides TaxID=74311 RepID=UPI000495C125|nr:LysE family translocator [Brevundimonas bacteroides]